MRENGEEGQAIVLVAVAMGIFLLGAVGLAVDGSHLYSQRQMAQSAADSAAMAGIMSIFDGTNGAGTHAFSTGSSFTCTTTDLKTPCVYAARNGFGATASDTVTVDFPAASAAPGVTLSTTDPTNLIRVTVQRNVNTTLMRLLRPTTFTTVKATAIAAIVNVFSPVPILVLHPTLPSSLSLQGNPAITICGGPTRSIQVNSGSSTALHTGGSASIDLSKAGPADSGTCTTGTGADLGVWGGPATKARCNYSWLRKIHRTGVANYRSTDQCGPTHRSRQFGKYGNERALANGVSGCPASPEKGCQLYYPGTYAATRRQELDTGLQAGNLLSPKRHELRSKLRHVHGDWVYRYGRGDDGHWVDGQCAFLQHGHWYL